MFHNGDRCSCIKTVRVGCQLSPIMEPAQLVFIGTRKISASTAPNTGFAIGTMSTSNLWKDRGAVSMNTTTVTVPPANTGISIILTASITTAVFVFISTAITVPPSVGVALLTNPNNRFGAKEKGVDSMGSVTPYEFDQMVASYRKSAEHGDKNAMKLLGDMYYQGPSGNEKNVSAALPWWEMAVENGNYSLAHKVGYAYYTGDGGTKDEKKALFYYLMATEYTVDAEAEYTVGLFYENGIGCHANKRKAIPYYELAALRGHANAQWRLGMLLFAAKKTDGLHWICCAHLSGIQEATDTLNHFISNGSGSEAIYDEISQIKRYGINYNVTTHEYNRTLAILFSVLKWGCVGFIVALLTLIIVCGFIIEMEHAPNLLMVLIIGLFGYLGYWWETN